MIDFNQWKKNILSSIRDIGDIEFQKEAWLGKNSNFVSSFNEDIAMLYDSFCFADDFWEEKNLNHFNLSTQLLEELKTLKSMIDSYERKSTDAEILNDPEWKKITEQAKKIVEQWESQ